jgi:hypothetical protein
MKRDVDLSRAILMFVEEHSPPQGGLDQPLEIDGYDRPTVLAHAQLLIDDGFVDGKVLEAQTGIFDVVIRKLTSSGHDAIAAARNDTGWQKAKKLATDQGIPLTLSVLVQILKAEARIHLGLP